MSEYNEQSYERLLQEWAFRREMVNHYCTALQLITPDDRDAQQRWQELSKRLSAAELAFSRANAQLRGYEQAGLMAF